MVDYLSSSPTRLDIRCPPNRGQVPLPADIKPDHDYRLRTDKVGTNGKTTLRWGGKLRRLYIGRRWGGEPITMVCIDNRVSIKITTTGAQIAAYTLTEEKIYYNKKDNELDPQQGN